MLVNRMDTRDVRMLRREQRGFAAHYVAVLFLFLLAATASFAQGTGIIYGTAVDSSGSVIPSTTIEITHVATGRVRTLVTGAE